MTRTAFDSELGVDRTTNPLLEAVGTVIPQRLVRRAIEVRVRTDEARYEEGEPVRITVEFVNRLPVPVELRTTQRIWGWEVDGFPEASDERRYMDGSANSLSFRSKERKRIRRRWDGRIKRVGSPTRWEAARNGAHEITAFIEVDTGSRLEDSTTVRIES